MKKRVSSLEFDGALVDTDLADGPTGPEAAAWLNERGIPSILETGQTQVAAAHRNVSLGVLEKPVSPLKLAEKLAVLRAISRARDQGPTNQP